MFSSFFSHEKLNDAFLTKHYNRLDPSFFMTAKWNEMKIGSMETRMFTSFYKCERPNDASLVETENKLESKQNIS